MIEAIESFATGDYVVTRAVAATVSHGIRVAGSTSTLQTGLASVQPVDGRSLRVFPEGTRAEDARVIYTTTHLYTRNASPALEPDTIAIDGETWTVYKVTGPWTLDGDTHYVVYAARGGTP